MGEDVYQNKLKQFGKKLNTASWYIGISAYQERNIFELSGSLRDDYEQGTNFRVLKCLQAFGLHPVVSNKHILSMVQMSRGNDLAFLYFLLEGFYKTEQEDGEFSTNEKLLMIAIAKLDLLPTIKELDRILPPPQYGSLESQPKERQTEFELKALSLRLKHMKAFQPKFVKKSIRKKAYILPYFERQPRPKARSLHLTCRPPSFVVSFPFWPRKGVPDYGKDLEPAWFTQYRLNPMSRMLRSIICEVVDKYINLKDLEAQVNEDVQRGSALLEEKKAFDDKPNYCLFHKGDVESAQLLKDELTVKARERFLELYDVATIRNKKRTKRILDQLEHDINECMERNAAIKKTEMTKVQTLTEADCVICKETRVPIVWPPEHQEQGRALVGSCLKLAHTAVADDSPKGKQLVDTFRNHLDFKGLTPEEPCPTRTAPKVQIAPVPSKKSDPKVTPKKKKKKKKASTKARPRKKGGSNAEPTCDPGHSRFSCISKYLCDPGVGVADQTCNTDTNTRAFVIAGGELKPKEPSPENRPKCDVILMKEPTRKSFFQAASSSVGPYKFKYHRIFQTGPKPYDLKKHIAKTFAKALAKPVEEVNNLFRQRSSTRLKGEDMPPSQDTDYVDSPSDTSETSDVSSSHSRRSHIDFRADVIDAVVNCVKTIWKHKEALKRIEMETAKKAAADPSILKYDMTYFDPNDEDLMDRLLRDGMQELKKDQRFVLASLPDSHKMPALREWIKRRFGKAYTQMDMESELEESRRIFEIVQAMQAKPPKADLKGLDVMPANQENFSNISKVQALGKKAMVEYYEKLNHIYMQQMNICWYAMGNYKNIGGPPRKTFYAYMASNPRGIIRRHVWNGEFRNYKQMRDLARAKKAD